MTRKKVLSVVLSLAVGVTMCFGMSGTAFAGTNDGGQFKEIKEQASISADGSNELNANSIQMQSSLDSNGVKAFSGSVVPLNGYLADIPESQPTVQINVPRAGYLRLGAIGYSYYNGERSIYSADISTKGYSRPLYFNLESERWIAVKKGTYTFTVNPIGDYYMVANKFTPVKEAKYGKKRTKAKKIKRGKYYNGLMTIGAQKAHWYKIKNKKTKKVKIYVRTMMSDTGKGGGLKVSFYKGKKRYGTQYVFYDNANRVTKSFKAVNTWSGKLKKGTYTVKVEPYNKATGYFQIKWK